MRRAPITTLAVAAFAILATARCGEPIRDGAYQGEPLAVIDGILDQPANSADPIPETLAVGLLWAGPDPYDLAGRIQQPGVWASLAHTDEFRLIVHDKPPPAARAAGYALGRLVLYTDLDGDRVLDPDEPIRNSSDSLRVVWSPEGLDPAVHPVTLPVPAGLHVIEGHLPCDQPFTRTRDVEDCGVPLGESCNNDRECGEPDNAVCGRDEGSRFPEGYCLARLTRNGCRPPHARRVPRIYRDGRWRWFWYRACDADADCPDPLICRPGSGACGTGSEQIRLLMGTSPGHICTAHLIQSRDGSAQ